MAGFERVHVQGWAVVICGCSLKAQACPGGIRISEIRHPCMTLAMKRRLVCAAAQEDDDSENEMVVKPPSKRQKEAPPPKERPQEAAPEAPLKDVITAIMGLWVTGRSRKEFAWMDSDEERWNFDTSRENGEDANEKKDEPVGSPKKSKPEDTSGSEDENADVSAATLDSVETFGRMMVLSPALLKKIPRQC
eukprot:Skav209121  [mRNA]  locus=scaffold179:447852:449754:- [translate_table: standard]